MEFKVGDKVKINYNLQGDWTAKILSNETVSSYGGFRCWLLELCSDKFQCYLPDYDFDLIDSRKQKLIDNLSAVKTCYFK